MQVKEVMTANPHCCTPSATLVEAARMMKECDCGAIPVVDDMKGMKPVGILTDRDIVIRCVAEGKEPSATLARECMSDSLQTISPEATLEECARRMEENQVRRLIVTENGRCRGLIVQAQVARHAPREISAKLIHEISQPSPELVRPG